jgi:hypothetical protein
MKPKDIVVVDSLLTRLLNAKVLFLTACRGSLRVGKTLLRKIEKIVADVSEA